MAGKRTRGSGELETAVMSVLWNSAEPVTSTEILSQMEDPVPAQTTLLTALHRLCEKGRVTKVGTARRGARFTATSTSAQHVSQEMLGRLDESSDRTAALLQFAGDLNSEDLGRLKDAIAARNRPRR